MMGTCDGAGEGRYVNVTDARYEEWLKNAYCDPTCPGEPNLALMELIREPSGYLDESDAAEAYTFTVPESTSSLVVTLNHGRGWFPSPNDFDLELPAALSPTCVKFIEAEVCEVSTPPPGVYSTIVRKVNGEAYYQLSAVAFLAAENSDNQQ
jgi:hypothetical protein